jgi:endonuclease/exonuclease/phosphatase (EEP) superfamily protein YafD
MKVISKSMGPKIVAGDFNLNMNTKAISEFEKKFINLIKNSNFQTTRSKLYDSIAEMPFADYIFASPEIVITNFKVVDVEISDHLPILIEFVN